LATAEADDHRAVLCTTWLSDTASRLVEVLVDFSIMAADWLANFS